MAIDFAMPQPDPPPSTTIVWRLEHVIVGVLAGVESLGEGGLGRLCGEAEGPYAEHPLAALMLHINRELIHHLAAPPYTILDLSE